MSLIVLVSGWGMSADLFSDAVVELESQGYRVCRLSLAQAPGANWDSLLTWLDSMVTEPALLVGWSLGGVLCARFAARYRDKVKALVTLASTPCFVRRPGWDTGQQPAAFRAFAAGLSRKGKAAALRFAAVCASGSLHPEHNRTRLENAVEDLHTGATDWQALLARLAEDSRASWTQLECPALHFLGASDALVPSDTARALTRLAPAHRVCVLAGCHALFLDQPQLLTEAAAELCGHQKGCAH